MLLRWLFLSFLLLTVPAAARDRADGPDEGERQGPRSMPPFSLTTSHFLCPAGDFEDRRGGFSFYQGEAQLGWTGFLSPRDMLSLSLSRSTCRYDFDSDTDLLPGSPEPFESLHRTGVELSWRRIFSPRLAGMASLETSWAGEEGAGLAESNEWLALVGGRWQWTPDVALTFGLVGLTRIEDDPLVFPGVMLDWRITDRLRLTTTRDLRLSYDLGVGWEVALAMGYEQQAYRLDRVGPLARGVVTRSGAPLRLVGSRTAWGGALQVEVSLGSRLWRELELADRRGHEIDSDGVEAGLEFGLQVRLRF